MSTNTVWTKLVATHSGRIAPTIVEAVTLCCLTVRDAFKALEHHHHGNDRWGNRAPSGLIEEIGKSFVGEEWIPLTVQERVDRILIEGLVAEPRHIVEQIALFVGLTERPVPFRVENYSVETLPDPGSDRESNPRGLSMRGQAKDTSHPMRPASDRRAQRIGE